MTAIAEPGRPDSGRRLKLFALAVFVAALGFRLFLIFSGRTVPDGDESVVGLMALHLLRGRPGIYFMGQSYGAGAGIEAALAAVFFSVLGPSGAALKLAGLTIWALLALSIARVARGWFGARAGAMALMLAAVAPAMAEWSTKTRGGHLLCLLPLVLLAATVVRATAEEPDARPARWALSAALCGLLAAWLQPLAIPAAAGLLLAAGAVFVRRRQWKGAALVAAGGMLVLFATAAAMFGPGVWRPIRTEPANLLPAVGRALTVTLLDSFTAYLDLMTSPLRTLQLVTGSYWLLLFLGTVAAALLLLVKPGGRENEAPALPVILWALLATIAGSALIEPGNLAPRHLLALYPFSVLLLAWGYDRLRRRRLAQLLFGGLLLMGAAGNLPPALHPVLFDASFYDPLPPETASATVKFLRERGIRYVFIPDYVFQWNVIFESREQVIARSYLTRDRWQPYLREVNRAAEAGFPAVVVIPVPEDRGRRMLAEALRKAPGVRAAYPVPEVLVLEGVPPRLVFRFFPRDRISRGRMIEEQRKKLPSAPKGAGSN